MQKLIAFLALSLTMLTAIGCNETSNTEKGATAAQPTSAATAEHAPSNVVPGSHEDWCDEHQVPESMCTRCNPALIAAFKATNDWCAEHNLPESQCLICNPNLKITRPPKKDGAQ